MIKKILFGTLFVMLTVFVLFLGGIYWIYEEEIKPNIPDVSAIKSVDLKQPLRIYSSDGKLMSEIGATRRYKLDYEQIPDYLKEALITAEDRRFYGHFGVDFKGILRAIVELIRTGEKSQGASTLTMQLARNYYLSRKKSYSRKIIEIILALRLEQLLSKDEILTLYMNKVFLGYRSYGFETAAQTYYGKSVNELTLDEAAMLSGLPKAPSAYNPVINPQRAKQRRDYILRGMHNKGIISEEELEEALNTPVHARLHGVDVELDAGHASEMVRVQVKKLLGNKAYTGGYQVYTTINSKYQQAAIDAVQKGLIDYNRRQPYTGPEKILEASFDEILEPKNLNNALKSITNIEGLTRGVVVQSENSTIEVYVSQPNDDWQSFVLSKQDMKWVETFDVNKPLTYFTLDDDSASTQTDQKRFIFEENDRDRAHSVLPIGALVYVQKINGKYRLASSPIAQVALISISPKNGQVYALVGGFNFRNYKYNRVVQANRQPGSNFKPFVYTAALNKGYTAASIINDTPVTFENSFTGNLWQPSNYSGKYFGPTRLREALVKSRNLVSVRLMHQLGVDYTLNFLRRFGFSDKTFSGFRDLSASLGSIPVSPWEIVRGYAVIANTGYLVEPYLIDHIKDSEGNIIYQHQGVEVCSFCVEGTQGLAKRVIDPSVSYIMSDILRDAVTRGTGRRAKVLKRRDIAGKTGTTNKQFDAWFSGFNHEFATTVWVGRDQPQSLGEKETGGRTALPIWINYMRVALEDSKEILPDKLSDIVTVRINPENGLLANSDDEKTILEIFRSASLPNKDVVESNEPYHGKGQKDKSLRSKLF